MIFYPFFKCPKCKTNNTPGPLIVDHQLNEEEYETVLCQECLSVYDASIKNYVFTSKKSHSTMKDDYNQIDPVEE